MAINERVITGTTAAAAGTGNQQEGLILHLDANDDDSYDGDGSVWYDITDHEYTPSVNPEENFNTVLYTGDGNTTRSITGVGFEPDLVWIKVRGYAQNHALWDSVRGASDGRLYSDNDAVPGTDTLYGQISTFDSDGFTFTKGTNAESYTNKNTGTYVAWCFKAGGAPTASNSGGQTPTSGSKMVDGTAVTDNYPTADIYPTKQSVNTKLGFSITQFEGAGSSKTLPHGLDAFPELYIIKAVDSANNWWTYTVEGGDFQYLQLNGTNAGIDADQYYDRPTAELVEQGQSLNDTSVMYAFTSKRGVSKVGSYKGTSSSVKVYTGFEPAFVLIKKTNSATNSNWSVFDNKRVSSGDTYGHLYPDENYQEDSRDGIIEFTGDGFDINNATVHQINNNGDSYIYLAFAKNTNETDLIGDTDLELHLDAGDSTTTSSNWDDLSSNTYGETITGTSYDKELGNWFSFGGNSDKVVIDDNGALTNVSNFTVEMWTYTQDNNDYRILWGNMDTSAGARQVYAYIDNNDRLEFTTYYNNSSNAYRINRTNSVASKLHNKWVHLAFVLSGGKVSKIYINGEEEPITHTSGSDSQMHTGSTIDTAVGGYHNSTQGTYGNIGQFRIYHAALTQAQVRQNYNFTKNDYPNGFNAVTATSYAPTFSTNHFDFDTTSSTVGDRFQINPPPFPSTSSTVNERVRSISLWARRNSTSSSTFGTLYHSSGKIELNYNVTDNRMEVWKWINGKAAHLSGTSNLSRGNGSTSINTDWHHYVFIMTGTGNSDYKLYIDKVEETLSKSITSTQGYTYSGSYIGSRPAYQGTHYQHFDGDISDVKVFDKILTTEEITAEYNKGQFGDK